MKLAAIVSLLGVVALVGLTEAQSEKDACPTQGTSGDYDYKQALCMSILFYEAQRSGPLPGNKRIDYRQDSALNDGSDVGMDFTGGYYDAGDHVKFGFPMAFTSTVLSWGYLKYKDGYTAAGQDQYIKEAIRWGTDYFLKCHISANGFNAQIGDGETDHGYWGRPEDMTMYRPANVTYNGGTEVLAETSAALSSAYMVFKDEDPTYAALLLEASKELLTYAGNPEVKYTDTVTMASGYYDSWSGFGDELAWASLWLFLATDDSTYMTMTMDYMTRFNLAAANPHEFSWDNKVAGIFALHTEYNTRYVTELTTFVDYLMIDAPRTTKGLLWISEWGSLRHAMNAAFILNRATDLGLGDKYAAEAENQVNYALGSGGERSFMVGFGNNPPLRPHHRSSSCPYPPEVCDWDDFNSPDPNPQTLYGALVGGPNQQDVYTDSRSDYVGNEVACDYNALLVGNLARMAINYP